MQNYKSEIISNEDITVSRDCLRTEHNVCYINV
jgi:hypothetical protein